MNNENNIVEITDLIKKALDLSEQSNLKTVIEHLEMALEVLSSGEKEEEDDFEPMMKEKGMGFGESMMKKSEEELL